MKSVKFLFLGLITLSIALAGCNDDAPPRVSNVEDGFYVVGEATAVADLFAENAGLALMAAGKNEADNHAVRTGMYEKYVALDGGTPFSLMLKAGNRETQYGAILTKVNLAGEEGESVNDQPVIEIYKGTLTENESLQVAESGLYHVIVDVSLETVIIAPVEWGIRGAMNNWGFTALSKPEFNKTAMSFSSTNVIVTMSNDFKFAYGSGWKIELDDAGAVKANTNVGNDGGNDGDALTAKLTSGGKNIGIARGMYTIALNWTLAKGDIKDGYSATITRTGTPEMVYPATLYMIGEEFGNWNWGSDEVVEMIPVYGDEGTFWCINYFTAGKGFRWSPEKNWQDGFARMRENTGFDLDGDAIVAKDGLYIVYIDIEADKIAIEPAKVYGFGGCFGVTDNNIHDCPFELNEDGDKLYRTTIATGELRMYVDSSIAASAWWTREFIILGGKIVYRGNGSDQTRVTVNAGKTITLDFKAGTGMIE
jgi:hypothetical protein